MPKNELDLKWIGSSQAHVYPPGEDGVWARVYEVIDCPDQIDNIIAWLANNCVGNFVVTKRVDWIMAGGCTNNKAAFEQGWFNTNKSLSHLEESKFNEIWKIKILKFEDALLFDLTWIRNEPSN